MNREVATLARIAVFRRSRGRRAAILALLALGGLLDGCGATPAANSGPQPAATAAIPSPSAAAPVTGSAAMVAVTLINATGMGGAFNPATVTIHAGDSVAWTNQSGNIHNVTFPMPAMHSPIMFGGDKWTFTFTTPGTYHYVCTYHVGMEGTVIVS